MRRLAPLAVVLVAAASACSLASCETMQAVRSPQTATAATGATTDAAAIHPLQDPGQASFPVTMRSSDGSSITITSADRVVPLNGSVAEIIFSLGLGAQVVGRDATTTFAEAEHLPTISTGHDIAAEGVLSLDPSLVIGDTRSGPPEVLDQIRAAGVAVLLLDEAWTIEAIAPRVQSVATAMGVPAAGRRLVSRTLTEVQEARDAYSLGGVRVAFLYVRAGAGIYLLGGEGSGADAMLAALGVIDVGAQAGLGPFTALTSEALASAAPDVLMVMNEGLTSVGGIDGLVRLPGVAQTPAGRERRVVSVDDGLLLNFGPRTGATLELLASQLAALDQL